MRGRFGRAWDDLRGRSAQRVLDLIQGQVAAARTGASLARSASVGTVPPADARNLMIEVEHRGDEERARLVRVLRRVLATPLDREDLFRLSRSVDDVLDQLRDFVRESDLFAPTDLKFAVESLDAVIAGLDELGTAVGLVLARPAGVGEAVLATRKSCTRVRQLHQIGLADLFAGPLDMETLRRRELLSRLDAVGGHLGTAADALADAMLKRSH